MADFEQLGPLLPVTLELDLFDYVSLDSAREPPPLELRACLVRGYEADEEAGEGLRLAFVAGHPVDSHDLLVLAYIARPAPEAVVWGVERWSSPQRRLRPYRIDPDFEPRDAAEVHAELKRLGTAAFQDHARGLLESSDS
jgi:hypothetical protein